MTYVEFMIESMNGLLENALSSGAEPELWQVHESDWLALREHLCGMSVGAENGLRGATAMTYRGVPVEFADRDATFIALLKSSHGVASAAREAPSGIE